MSDSILMFTPTKSDRITNPFYQPCRDSRRDMLGITERLEDTTVRSAPELGAAYQRAHEHALEKRHDYLLIVEDDEQLDIKAALSFLSIAKATDNTIYGGCKRLRGSGVMRTPWIWVWMHPDNSPLGHPKNDLIQRVIPIGPNPGIPYIKVMGGVVTSPMFYNVQWFEEKGLAFEGGKSRLGFFSNQDSEGWDTLLSHSLNLNMLHFWACPPIYAKHYDGDTHSILSG